VNNGWIKIHRKIRDNCIYKDSHLLHLFIHCLLKANHKINTFLFNKQEITIERGQFVTGRLELAKELNMNSSLVYRKLKILENIGIVNIKTNNKFSIVTVLKYNTYQDVITTSEQQNEQQVNNKRTTSEQQVNTNKNNKKEKNDKNEVGKDKKTFTNIPPSIADIIKRGMELKYSGIEREAERFFNHYESNGWKVGKNPMRNWSASLCNWYKNINQFNSNGIYKPKDLEPEKF
jgi:predicted transcriptional regulator